MIESGDGIWLERALLGNEVIRDRRDGSKQEVSDDPTDTFALNGIDKCLPKKDEESKTSSETEKPEYPPISRVLIDLFRDDSDHRPNDPYSNDRERGPNCITAIHFLAERGGMAARSGSAASMGE